MHKYRGLYVFASAIIWSALLWGVTQIKPAIFHPPIFIDTPSIGSEREPPPPPDLPEPIKDPIKEKVVELPKTPTLTGNKTQTNTHTTKATNNTQNGPPPPQSDGNNTDGSNVANPPIITATLIEQPEIKPQYIKTEPECSENRIAANPRQPFNVERAYPTRLAEDGVTGTVHATWQIDENGNPERIRIDSSTDSGFDAAVIREGMKMKFRPARENCENTDGVYSLYVRFELKDE